MNRNEPIPPNWTAVKIDESRDCDPEFLKRCGGKCYQIYLYDANCVTYCCEVTPSYCMIPTDLVAEKYPEDDGEREALYEELREVLSQIDGVSYMHCHYVDGMLDEAKHALQLSVDPEDWETELRGEDEAREEYQGCPVF